MIYLDNAATTKPCEETVSAVTSALTEQWGNPSSRHAFGVDAKRSIDAARKNILSTLGVKRPGVGELLFCGSGTEANNLAVLGVCRSKKRRGRIIISDSEHASVRAAADAAVSEGFEVVTVPTRGGALDLDALKTALTPDTVLVSIMLVNNETGARYDVETAYKMARAAAPNVICHCDAIQGYMKVPFTVKPLGADLVTLSGHKIHATKGIGALYVSADVLRARAISPVIFGGGHESGLRSGTVDVPAVLGFAAAARRAYATVTEDTAKMRTLREYTAEKLISADVGVKLNLPQNAAPHILSVTLPGIKSETALNFLSERGICVSSGSACSTHSRNISSALLAFGLTASEADTTIRVSLSRDTTEAECNALVDAIIDAVRGLARVR